METWKHSFLSLILVAVSYPLFGWQSIIIFAGGVLIDIDHYFWYAYRYRKLSVIACYRHFIAGIKKKDFSENFGILLVFHTIEFLAFVVVLSFYSKIALIFLIGLLPHYLLDAIFIYTLAKRVISDHSVIHWAYKNLIQKV